MDKYVDFLNTDAPKNCGLDNTMTRIYLQYKCDQKENLKTFKNIALIISSIFVWIALLFLVNMYQSQTEIHINSKLWDFDTLSLSDFTVEIPIYQEQIKEDDDNQGSTDLGVKK